MLVVTESLSRLDKFCWATMMSNRDPKSTSSVFVRLLDSFKFGRTDAFDHDLLDPNHTSLSPLAIVQRRGPMIVPFLPDYRTGVEGASLMVPPAQEKAQSAVARCITTLRVCDQLRRLDGPG